MPSDDARLGTYRKHMTRILTRTTLKFAWTLRRYDSYDEQVYTAAEDERRRMENSRRVPEIAAHTPRCQSRR